LQSQNLDRISLSSGGDSNNEFQYVIGESFNFNMAAGATFFIETGSLASSDNTGGDNNFTRVRQLAELKQIFLKYLCFQIFSISLHYEYKDNDRSERFAVFRAGFLFVMICNFV